MAQDATEFELLVQHAMPYARQCGDIAGFAHQCAKQVKVSGEPAFYLTTKKLFSEPKRFPISLEMWGYDESTGKNVLVGDMDIDRPDYKSNPHGFLGNHLVVALLDTVRSELKNLISEGIEVLTSQTKWSALTHGDGYRELKAQRALNRAIPTVADPVPRKAPRL